MKSFVFFYFVLLYYFWRMFPKNMLIYGILKHLKYIFIMKFSVYRIVEWRLGEREDWVGRKYLLKVLLAENYNRTPFVCMYVVYMCSHYVSDEYKLGVLYKILVFFWLFLFSLNNLGSVKFKEIIYFLQHLVN